MSFTVRTIESNPPKPRRWTRCFKALLIFGQPLFHVLVSCMRRHEHQRKLDSRKRTLRTTFVVLLSVLFAFVLLAGIAKALMTVRGLGLTEVVSFAGADLPEDDHGYTNFLVLGQGHVDHDGKDLTDSIMVVSLDPHETRSAVLLSFPRDLYFLKTEHMDKGRLNSFYRDYKNYLIFRKGMEEDAAEKEAIAEIAKEVGNAIGLPIHHAVKIDFVAFKRIVDVIGGIEIAVPETIEDYDYPDESFGYEPFVIEAGVQQIDGETALKYARSRSTTSDFNRSARQQQLIRAIGHKAKEEGFLRDGAAITSLMKIMSENVVTTMTLRELIGAASLAQNIDQDNIVTMQLSDRNALYDSFIEPGGFLYTPPRDLFEGASVLLPISVPEFPVTWRMIRNLTELLFRHRSIYLTKPTIAVLNAGAPEGSARRLSTELIRYGFDVQIIENADIEEELEAPLILTTEEDATVAFFGTLLGMDRAAPPEGLPPAQRKDITIILGKSYRYTRLQDLVPHLIPEEDVPTSS